MKKSLVEIYGMLVCFITVVVFIFAICSALYNLVRLSNPQLTLDGYQYEIHQSNNQFVQHRKDLQKKTQKQITALRKETYAIALKGEKRIAARELIRESIVIFVSIILYIFHWKIAQKARLKEGQK